MAQVKKTVLVMHSCEEMYKLVDAVEDYPKFLPWCGGVDLHQRTDISTHATIHINYHGIKQHFSTTNQKQYPNAMHIQLVDGPFKHMAGHWYFIALREDACKIEFELSYEFSNTLLEKMIAPVFHHIANTFVDSFVTYADQRYAEH
jgi:ribosome-associated toxin RatA of RatAB toxin-antitoxin module